MAETKDPYLYPETAGANTPVLINLAGERDPAEADKFERVTSTNAAANRVENFTPDMNGLKAVHQNLFKDVYEWAGKTRAEPITIDGRTIQQNPHAVLTKKPDFQSGHAALSERALPQILDRSKTALDQAHEAGALTKTDWAKHTAQQVGAINFAHPFRDGNGRTMRSFIEHSPERDGYEMQANTLSKEDWMKHSHNAMDYKNTEGLAKLIDAHAFGTEKANDFEALKAEGAAVSALQREQGLETSTPTTWSDNSASADSGAGPGLPDGKEADYGLER